MKYGDEKHLKGKEIYCRKTRRNVITRRIDPILTASDLTNTYSIIGSCGIDCGSTAVFSMIFKGTNNAESFAMEVDQAIESGFLSSGDALVLDIRVLIRAVKMSG